MKTPQGNPTTSGLVQTTFLFGLKANTNTMNREASASTQGTKLNITMEFDCMKAHYYSI